MSMSAHAQRAGAKKRIPAIKTGIPFTLFLKNRATPSV